MSKLDLAIVGLCLLRFTWEVVSADNGSIVGRPAIS